MYWPSYEGSTLPVWNARFYALDRTFIVNVLAINPTFG